MSNILNGLSEHIISQFRTHVVAVEIQRDSPQSEQFAEIFPFTAVPSLHFIGSTGVRSEQLDSSISEEEFVNRLKSALEKHISSKSPEEIARKIEKAKQLIEENRIKKQQEEKEKEKERELERIRAGKEISKAREMKQQAEYQNIVAELEKDKLESRIAHQRVGVFRVIQNVGYIFETYITIFGDRFRYWLR